jgi:hypothetical protein
MYFFVMVLDDESATQHLVLTMIRRHFCFLFLVVVSVHHAAGFYCSCPCPRAASNTTMVFLVLRYHDAACCLVGEFIVAVRCIDLGCVFTMIMV